MFMSSPTTAPMIRRVLPGGLVRRFCLVLGRCGTRATLYGAFAALKQAGYDAYCVFDADNLVDPDFLARMNDAFCAGAQAAKGKQTAMNPHDAWISGCYDLYFENFNLLYNRPRGNLGLSVSW